MAKVLIAYNNDSKTTLHDFFESCADEAKQACIEKGIDFDSVFPPAFTEVNLTGNMRDHSICLLAGHGDENGVYNEDGNDVVSTRTTNYYLKGKGLYSISCCCAQNLYPLLSELGLRLFVGYNSTFHVRGDSEFFVKSALSGFKCFISGNTAATAKEYMLSEYDKQIEILDEIDPMSAVEMVHNKEALFWGGEKDLVISDLQ